jgi:hypothetical protein
MLLFVIGINIHADTGLREETIEAVVQGTPIVRTDFEKSAPAEAVVTASETALHSGEMRDRLNDCWVVRRPGWTKALLNAHGHPPDIEYDPGLTMPCDIYLDLRAVTPRMTFGIKLSSEKDFTIITEGWKTSAWETSW